MGKALLVSQACCAIHLPPGSEPPGTTPEPFLLSGHTVQRVLSLKTGDRGPGAGTKLFSQEG